MFRFKGLNFFPTLGSQNQKFSPFRMYLLIFCSLGDTWANLHGPMEFTEILLRFLRVLVNLSEKPFKKFYELIHNTRVSRNRSSQNRFVSFKLCSSYYGKKKIRLSDFWCFPTNFDK